MPKIKLERKPSSTACILEHLLKTLKSPLPARAHSQPLSLLASPLPDILETLGSNPSKDMLDALNELAIKAVVSEQISLWQFADLMLYTHAMTSYTELESPITCKPLSACPIEDLALGNLDTAHHYALLIPDLNYALGSDAGLDVSISHFKQMIPRNIFPVIENENDDTLYILLPSTIHALLLEQLPNREDIVLPAFHAGDASYNDQAWAQRLTLPSGRITSISTPDQPMAYDIHGTTATDCSRLLHDILHTLVASLIPYRVRQDLLKLAELFIEISNTSNRNTAMPNIAYHFEDLIVCCFGSERLFQTLEEAYDHFFNNILMRVPDNILTGLMIHANIEQLNLSQYQEDAIPAYQKLKSDIKPYLPTYEAHGLLTAFAIAMLDYSLKEGMLSEVDYEPCKQYIIAHKDSLKLTCSTTEDLDRNQPEEMNILCNGVSVRNTFGYLVTMARQFSPIPSMGNFHKNPSVPAKVRQFLNRV